MATNTMFGGPVRTIYDANGNVVGLGVGGKRQLPRSVKSNIYTRVPSGSMAKVANFGGLTHHIQAALAAVPIAIRVGIANNSAETPTIAGSFGFGTVPGTPASTEAKGNNITNWLPFTFDSGAASGTHTAGAQNAPTWVFSDWMDCVGLERTDGEAGAIVHVNMIQGVEGGEGTAFSNIWSATTTQDAATPHFWRGFRTTTAVDYATTNQSSFTSATGIASHLAVIIQYISLQPGITLLNIGDSIAAGTAAAGSMVANGYGWLSHARDLLSSSDFPVETANLAAPSQSVSVYYNRLNVLADKLSDCLFVPPIWSVNNISAEPDATEVATMKGYFGRFLNLAHERNWFVYPLTSTPVNATEAGGGLGGASAKLWGASDALRTALDTELLARYPFVFDRAAVLSGIAVASGSAAGQIEYTAAYTTDGLHPNDTGYYLVGEALAKELRGRIW